MQHVDMLLVGDSMGNVFYGHENTLPVTLDQIIYHTQAVVKGAKQALVVADMPFMSAQISTEETKRNAGLLLKEGGAQAVKIEVTSSNLSAIKSVLEMGIPVMAHLGLTPQSVHQLGGYKMQGKTEQSANLLLELAKECEKIGCFSIVLELIQPEITAQITQSVSIPTIGIGSGKQCDGQVLVTQDLLGLTFDKVPGFVKPYANLNDTIKNSIASYVKDIKNNK